MVKVGIAGIGFMGMIHYLAYQKIKGVKVAALCEVDEKRLAGDWTGIKGNFGPAGKQMDLSGIARYTRLDEMLADPKLDMVDLCLPPGAHAAATIAALKAGKQVFCEKPIALKTSDGRRMVKTAQETGRMLMIGHVLPFFPEYAFAHKTVTDGTYGRLLGGHFKRNMVKFGYCGSILRKHRSRAHWPRHQSIRGAGADSSGQTVETTAS